MLKILSVFHAAAVREAELTHIPLPPPLQPPPESVATPSGARGADGDEWVMKRRALCVACEHVSQVSWLRFLLPASKCTECGCFIAAKTLLPFARCPVGKW